MIPRTLKIRGRVYTVTQVNLRELGPDAHAFIDFDHLTIKVYKRLPYIRKVELVLHEALHGMLNKSLAKDEEAIVSLLCGHVPLVES